jgi:hypothetical protein
MSKRRATLIEQVESVEFAYLDDKIDRATYLKRLRQLHRRRTVMTAWLYVLITGYFIGAGLLLLGALYGLILFFVMLGDLVGA